MKENFNHDDEWGELYRFIRGIKTMLTDIPYEIEEKNDEGEDTECPEKAKK